MVEVYHSARLHCAASHELMMKAGRDGERERADCSGGEAEAATEGRTGEQGPRVTDETEIFGREGRSATLKLTDLVCLERAAKSACNKEPSWPSQPLLGSFWSGCCSEPRNRRNHITDGSLSYPCLKVVIVPNLQALILAFPTSSLLFFWSDQKKRWSQPWGVVRHIGILSSDQKKGTIYWLKVSKNIPDLRFPFYLLHFLAN